MTTEFVAHCQQPATRHEVVPTEGKQLHRRPAGGDPRRRCTGRRRSLVLESTHSRRRTLGKSRRGTFRQCAWQTCPPEAGLQRPCRSKSETVIRQSSETAHGFASGFRMRLPGNRRPQRWRCCWRFFAEGKARHLTYAIRRNTQDENNTTLEVPDARQV